MHARLARYAVSPERVGDAVEGFRNVGADLESLEGFVNGYLLVDADSGTLSSLTLWRDHRALDQSSTRASAMRLRAVREADGECVAVTEFEVALTFGDAGSG